jgi:hypothetical protein
MQLHMISADTGTGIQDILYVIRARTRQPVVPAGRSRIRWAATHYEPGSTMNISKVGLLRVAHSTNMAEAKMWRAGHLM